MIEVEDLVVRYGEVTAVDGISFEAKEGEVVALLGPNGAGKTSTIETLEGYRRPDGWVGSGCWASIRSADHERLTRSIGVMLQGGGVYPGIRCREVLRLFAVLPRRSRGSRGAARPDGARAPEAGDFRTLSGGEQQRLALALALVGRPGGGVPRRTDGRHRRRAAGRWFGGHRRAAPSGACVLVTTHDLHEAEKVADRVVIVDHGHVVADGSPSELMQTQGAAEIRFGAPPGIDTTALGKALSATGGRGEPGRVRRARSRPPRPPSPT